MFCIKCGAENVEAARFCRKCGQPMYHPGEEPAATEPKSAAVVPPPAPVQASVPPPPPPQPQPVIVQPPPVSAQPPPVQTAAQPAAAPPVSTAPVSADAGQGSGLQPNVAAALSYVAGWVTGIIFLLIGGKNEFVKFNAWQSIITFASISVLYIVFGIISAIITFLLSRFFIIAILFNIIFAIFSILCLVLWVILIIRAYQSRLFKLPVIGNIAAQMVSKHPGS
jgi:uncharacterized membrane protein